MPGIAIEAPSMYLWAMLFESCTDQALITLIRFDHRAPWYVLARFHNLHNKMAPYSKDGFIARKCGTVKERKRKLSPRTCLCLSVTWYRTTGTTVMLCILHGIMASVCTMFIMFVRRNFERSSTDRKDANG